MRPPSGLLPAPTLASKGECLTPGCLPACRSVAISDGLGAVKFCCQSLCGSLAFFFVISSLFSVLDSRAAARRRKVRRSSVVQYFHKGIFASVGALPASQFSSFHSYFISICVTWDIWFLKDWAEPAQHWSFMIQFTVLVRSSCQLKLLTTASPPSAPRIQDTE